MQHVVIVTLATTHETEKGRHTNRKGINIPAFDKQDALAMAAALKSLPVYHRPDGFWEYERRFEAGCVVHTHKGPVTLSQDDIEMIAQEYTSA